MKLKYLFGGTSLLFLILAVFVSLGITTPLDTAVLYSINAQSTPGLDSFFVVITQLGGVVFVTATTLLLVIGFMYRKMNSSALFIASAVGGAALLGLLLKAVFERSRPDLWQWIIHETNFSFPSGHSVASAALAMAIVALLWHTKWRVIAMVVAVGYILLIGLSRLYLGVHFPTDILGGWLFATAWVALVLLVINAYNAKTTNKRRLKL